MNGKNLDIGHLYVIDGDLQELAVDAWLLPTDSRFNVTGAWEKTFASQSRFELTRLAGWQGNRAVFMETIDGVDVWLGDVGRDGAPASHYLAVASEFIERASNQCRAHAETENRLPIVALNHLGTGKGGGYDRHGSILSELIAGIRDRLNRRELIADVVLVAWGDQPESASQFFRAGRESEWQADPQWDFGARTQHLHDIALDLARRAREDSLSIFLGAGTSVGAGLPNWKTLLAKVAAVGGVLNDGEVLDDLQDLRDQAALIDVRLRQRQSPGTIHELLKDALSHTKYSLQHALIASLPCNEFITTNVDELFEKACRTNNRPLTVMPEKQGDGRRWLLKLHGTVSEPSSMVFTRENYLDAGRSSRALIGLVQAMLFTRHMLFVGYGLADEDFHELVYEVKRAFGTKRPSEPIGTVLLLNNEPLKSEIWSDVLRVVPVGGSTFFEHNARDIARFMDLVGMLSAEKHMFLLDDRYSHALDDSALVIKDLLLKIPLLIDEHTPGRDEIFRFLHKLGLR